MKEGARVYGKKHERKMVGRWGRKRSRGNLLRKRSGPDGVELEALGRYRFVESRP